MAVRFESRARWPQSGWPPMDEEHRVQFQMIDALAASIAEARPPAEIDAAIARLIEFLRSHFLSEQLEMERYRYPERGSHARAHDQAIELLDELHRRHAAGSSRWSLESLGILRSWLAAHVEDADRSLAIFLRHAGSHAAPE